MIGFLLFMFVVVMIVPGLLRGMLRVGAALIVVFGVWLLLHPDCESDACRQAVYNYQNNVR